MSRALGVMLVCGGLVTVGGITLASPGGVDKAGVYAVGIAAVVVGLVAAGTARHARRWSAHALFAAGTGLICLGTWFTGAPTGLYALLLVWVAIVAATFFSPRAVAAHMLWILVASGAILATIDSSTGASPAVRWVVGGLLLGIAATVMTRIAAGRRATEQLLRAEIAERKRLQRQLEHLAGHDPLTGVANRRRLEERIATELARARREDSPLCVVTLDLDDLKAHNDTHGHAAGDRLLQRVAATWDASLRAGDLIARTGGDEFVLLLPNCTLADAEALMARLCAEVGADCGCSAGAARWDGRESADELQSRADLAMYAEKARAREAVEIAAYRTV
ncbi:MAG: GGDEF domain-containing protein [Solirubrobacterales bacterium]|nr:GGDEF domain-containing protein [Solirubrobacterales bacterium]